MSKVFLVLLVLTIEEELLYHSELEINLDDNIKYTAIHFKYQVYFICSLTYYHHPVFINKLNKDFSRFGYASVLTARTQRLELEFNYYSVILRPGIQLFVDVEHFRVLIAVEPHI